MKNVKIPFYKKKWFLYLSLVILPLFGILIIWIFHRDMAKQKKTALTAVAAIWFILIPFIGGGSDNSIKSDDVTASKIPEVTQSVTVESEQTVLTTDELIVTTVTTAETSRTSIKPAVTTCSTTNETITQPIATTTKETTTAETTKVKEPEDSKTAHETEVSKYSSAQNNEEQREDEELYVLNTNTMKFHHSYCSSVKTIHDENYDEYFGTREEVIERGYEPCGRCHP